MALTLEEQEFDKKIKEASLDLKFDKQLTAMRESHANKLAQPIEDLDKTTRYPDAIRWELEQSLKEEFNGQALTDAVEEELISQRDYYLWKTAKLNEIVELIDKEIDFRRDGKVTRKPIGTTYYIDPVNGTDTYTGTKITGTIDSTADSTHFVDSTLTGADDYINGSFFYNETTGKGTLISDFVAGTDTATLTDADASMAAGDTYFILHAYKTLHKFGESTRSIGDRAILRRGMTNRYDDGGDMFFLTDGTIDAPIIMEADYANNWKDDVDLSATATATLIFGSKTITFASDISGVLAAGDWIYVATEDAKEFAYEVATVVTTNVTLFLPYNGDQAGSGKTMTNMQSTPIWNIASGDFQWSFVADDFWKAQGIHIKGTDSNGNVKIDSAAGLVFKDCIFEGDGVSTFGIRCIDDKTVVLGLKCRFYNHTENLESDSNNGAFTGLFKDCLFDNADSAINVSVWDDIIFEECESKNQTIGDLRTGATGATGAHQS